MGIINGEIVSEPLVDVIDPDDWIGGCGTDDLIHQ
jgi:hypothetical protein